MIPPRKKALSDVRRTGTKLASIYHSYLGKDVEEYNSQDLVLYFSQSYKQAKGVPYFTNMKVDAAKMKRLMNELDNYSIVKLIDFTVANKEDISIGMLTSSWVNTFLREAGIKHPMLSKYEAIQLSPFLTPKEKELMQSWLDFAAIYMDNGQRGKANKYLAWLSKAKTEADRRRKLLWPA